MAAGAGDQAAGALGVGVDRRGRRASVVLGTSGVVFAALDGFAPDPQARVHAFCHAVPGAWHAMGVMLSAAGSLRWLRDVAAPGESFDAARARRPRRGSPGRRASRSCPTWRASARRTPTPTRAGRSPACRCATTAARSCARCSRAWPSACATRSTWSRRLARAPSSGRVSGGGARSDLWLRIVASVLELPLERTAVDEGAAFGAALLGGVAGGVWADVGEAVRATVRPAARVDPEPGWVEPCARRASASGRCIPRCASSAR